LRTTWATEPTGRPHWAAAGGTGLGI